MSSANVSVDFVIDMYRDPSIKDAARAKRAAKGTVLMKIVRPDQPCPKQWKAYLAVGANKQDLVAFLVKEWSTNISYASRLCGPLHVTSGEECHVILPDGPDHVTVSPVLELFSNYEEADTRLILHAKHAALAGITQVIVKSPDTDVAVIATSLAPTFPPACQLLFKTGTRDRARYIDILALATHLGEVVCGALPGMHALTGCDTVSALSGKGKKSAVQLLRQSDQHTVALSRLGSDYDLTPDVFAGCERFVAALYKHPEEKKIDVVRYRVFCSSSGQSSSLPPTQDDLFKHCQRAAYQAAIWKRSCEAKPNVPHPRGHGRCVTSAGNLEVQWMDRKPAPDELLELISCGCSTGCISRACSWKGHGLRCTDMCKCGDKCENRPEVIPDVIEEDDSDAE